MSVSLRRFGGVMAGGLFLVAAMPHPMSAQQAAPRPPAATPGPAVNPNIYVNPAATRGRFANTAVLGKAPQNGASDSILNYSGLSSAPLKGQGYGTLAASYATPGLGYGSLMNSYGGGGGGYGGAYGGYGALGGFGMFGTQWMMNPYQGYLSGAASVTNANAQYQMTIQQAKLVRQQAIQESIRTRRAWLEQAEYERAHMPDPEKIRQRALERELDRARVSPPLTEISSGRSLNALLRHLLTQQGAGAAAGPDVPLAEDTLKAINLTSGDTRGNIGLLKDRGELRWPQALRSELFKNSRAEMTRRMKQAYQSAQRNGEAESSTIRDLQVDLKGMRETLDANISKMSPDEYNEASRYVKSLSNTLTALKDRNVSNYFNGTWTARGKNVAELIQHMREKGLWFAPASPGDQSAYTALYNSLAAFDRGLPRVARSSDSGEGDK